MVNFTVSLNYREQKFSSKQNIPSLESKTYTIIKLEVVTVIELRNTERLLFNILLLRRVFISLLGSLTVVYIWYND